jgi:lysophospholipase L1-like esterase
VRRSGGVSKLVPRTVGLGGLVVLAVLLTTVAACSREAERETRPAGHDATRMSAHQRTTTSGEPTEATPTHEGESTRRDSRARWDYVALGDSLAAGVGGRRGYVTRYAERLRSGTGARVRVINLGVSGQTSSQLLYALRNDQTTRRALGKAEVVTLNIGLNDLGRATVSYQSGECGGPQNKACLGESVNAFERNWDAIIEEISSSCPPDDTILRTAGFGYTPRAAKVFRPYVREATRHIASSAAEAGMLHTGVRLDDEDMSEDGLHPNDKGYRMIADRLAKLGYKPLGPRAVGSRQSALTAARRRIDLLRPAL